LEFRPEKGGKFLIKFTRKNPRIWGIKYVYLASGGVGLNIPSKYAFYSKYPWL